MPNAIGVVEWRSIALGIQATDAMLDAAEVTPLVSSTVCSGKYVTVVAGDVSSVRVAVEIGEREGKATLIEAVLIPNIHADVQPAITATTGVENIQALGVVESFSVSGAIFAADAAAKAAEIQLIEVRCARGLGGKAFVTMTGSVDSVTMATEIAADTVRERGVLAASTVIPEVNRKLCRFLL